MRIPILTFGAIASILTINSVLADTVVTSRNYVDTQDALKQDKITAGTTGSVVTYNGAQNGQTQFSERGIFNFKTDFNFQNNTIAPGHEGDLVTADFIYPAVGQMYNQIQEIQNNMPTGTADTVVMYDNNGDIGGERGIYDGSTAYDSSTDADKLVTASVVQNVSNNMPMLVSTTRVCTEWVAGESHTDENCLLWDLVYQNVYGRCQSNADCPFRYTHCDTTLGTCIQEPFS